MLKCSMCNAFRYLYTAVDLKGMVIINFRKRTLLLLSQGGINNESSTLFFCSNRGLKPFHDLYPFFSTLIIEVFVIYTPFIHSNFKVLNSTPHSYSGFLVKSVQGDGF